MTQVPPKHTQQLPQLQLSSQNQLTEAPTTGTGELVDYSTHDSAPSPAGYLFSSQNSDMDKILCDIVLNQGSMEDSPSPTPLVSAAPPQEYPGDPAIIARFPALLDQGLERVTKCITSDLKQEFQNLGTRIGTVESKLDETIVRIKQNTNCIEEEVQRLEEALNKIDNLEKSLMPL